MNGRPFFLFATVIGLQVLLAFSCSAGMPPVPDGREDPQLALPEGFKAYVVADGLGRARHIQVRNNGDLFVSRRRSGSNPGEGGIVALRDGDGDGYYEVQEPFFPDDYGTGLKLRGEFLYFGADTRVYRFRLSETELLPEGEAELMVSGFPDQRSHEAKPIAFDGRGNLFVVSGNPTNNCQEKQRTPGSPGLDPCPHLEWTGGIWLFDAEQPGQTLKEDGVRFATGLRHSVALAWSPSADGLYVVQHGRDQLDTLWPEFYTAEENAELPAEEVHRVEAGSNLGWPYTYWNHLRGERMLSPEYGGDGETVSDREGFQDPVYAFPGHWAPNDLVFYSGDSFPAPYHNGAFVAFHGSWNRAPMPQRGYLVAFLPFSDGKPSGPHQVFANNFAGKSEIRSPREADHRPCGLAVGPDGSLFVVDSVKGRVWRIVYNGEESVVE